MFTRANKSAPWVALLIVPVIAAMASLADAQQGGDASASMQVTANVIRKCTIQAQPMNFGNYDPVQANATAPLDGQSVITVACTKGTSVNLGMDNGTNAQGQNRRMSGGATNYLRYEVYKDASRTEVWGSTGNAVYDAGIAPSRDPRQFIAYGRVVGGQDVEEGNFQDTVLVTVDF